MSIKTDELQLLQSVVGTDSVLLDTASAGTVRVSLATLAEFLAEQDNAVKAALSSKAALSAQETVEKTAISGQTVTLAASELQAYLNSLPRLVTDELYLYVAGELSAAVEVKNFYGPGILSISGQNGGFTMRNSMNISRCALPVYLEKIEFQEPENLAENSAMLILKMLSRGNVRFELYSLIFH